MARRASSSAIDFLQQFPVNETPTDTNWEADTEFLCNNLLYKFQAKKDELKQKEKDLLDLKRSLEEEFQNKVKEYEDRQKELESHYNQKIKVWLNDMLIYFIIFCIQF